MRDKYYKQLEAIMGTNLEQRGMEGSSLPGELRGAAESLLGAKTVFIVTGFVIRDAMAGETDGPVGAVSLAGALEQLGKKAVLITDKYSEDILHSCIAVKKLSCPTEIISVGYERLFCVRMLEKYRLTHMVAIERPGRAMDGRCYSMKGEDLSDIVPNTDILLEAGHKQGAVTIAVGDGGNEAGMGKIGSYVASSVNNGKKICAALTSDFLISAGVSNWGGHALTAALSVMTGVMLLHDAATEVKLLESIVKAGAVDGLTKQGEMTVDGLSLEANLDILKLLRSVAEKGIKKL